MDTLGATRGHGGGVSGGRGRGVSRNKQWFPEGSSRPHSPGHSDGERSQRGGRGRGRGRGQFARGGPTVRTFPNKSLRNPPQSNPTAPGAHSTTTNGLSAMVPAGLEEDDNDEPLPIIEEPELDAAEREQLYQELVAGREQERKKAIAEGKMDDPNVPKRLEDAISIVGTCPDMCPRFERYRREREKNYDKWERIPGTTRIDHQRAVKVYERAAGDKVLPSDLRPPHVLRKTLDYLFHDLLMRGGLTDTFPFIRDRSRAVRNDFTIQLITGPSAIEAHVRCVRFHILVMHFERENKLADMHLEEQQCMNALLSLRDFYEDQRGKYQSPEELEMRIYHRLLHIRDQKERQDGIPEHILNHPAFQLVTDFRLRVQVASGTITKRSTLVVDGEGMRIFGRLVGVLKEMGNTIMTYLVACIMERLFGADTIEDIEALRGGLSLPDIIDGRAEMVPQIAEVGEPDSEMLEDEQEGEDVDELDQFLEEPATEEPAITSSVSWPTVNTTSQSNVFGTQPKAASVFGAAPAQPTPTSIFAASQSAPAIAQASAFSNINSRPNVFGNLTFGAPTSASQPASVFGSILSTSSSSPTPPNPPPPQQSSFPPKPAAQPVVFPAPNQPPPSRADSGKPPFIRPGQSKVGEAASPFSLSKPPDFFSKPAAIPSAPASSLFSSSPAANGAFPKPNNGSPPQLNAQAPSFSPSGLFTPPQPVSTPPSVLPVSQSGLFPPLAGPSVPAIGGPAVALPPKLTASISAGGSRASPPPPLKIDTAWSTSSSTSTPPVAAVASTSTSNVGSNTLTMVPPSPREPPALERVQPVSLPSTPTIWNPPQSALMGHLKSNLGTPPATATPERPRFLSPLAIQTPRTGIFPPTPSFSPAPSKSSFGLGLAINGNPSSSPSTGISLSAKAKGKGKEPIRPSRDSLADLPEEVVSMMEDQALAFEANGVIVRECWGRWLKKIMDKAAWIEACKQSDAYQEKMRQQRELEKAKGKERQNGAANGSPRSQDLKRRMSSSLSLPKPGGESPQRKKARKRVSSVYRPPRTDEELAARFKQNQTDVERRWAQGSFLKLLRTYFASRLPPPPTSTLSTPLSASQRHQPFQLPAVWQLWLSLNPSSESTAIWIERKFDMPDAGKFIGDYFSIPVGVPAETDESVPEHPGLVLFECTPLDGVDELEQKYLVLDDTSRLRQIIESFPQRRYYRPSILFMCWARSTAAFAELFQWTSQRVADGTICAYQTMLLNTEDKDSDANFERALKSTKLDVQGELVKALTVRDLFKHFSGVLNPFVSEWVNTCSSNPKFFNWKLYNLLLHMTVGLLNRLVVNFCQLSQSRGGASHPESVGLPEFEDGVIDDSESTYKYVKEWLSEVLEETDVDVSLVSVDIESHQKIEQEFPFSAFLDHLLETAQAQAEGVLEGQSQAKMVGTSGPTTRYLVLKAELDLFTESLEESLATLRVKLSHRLNTTARREPRRRTHSNATSETASPTCKRMRLSDADSVNGVNGVSRSSSPVMNGLPNGYARQDSETTSIVGLSADTSSMAVSAAAASKQSLAELRALMTSVKNKHLLK